MGVNIFLWKGFIKFVCEGKIIIILFILRLGEVNKKTIKKLKMFY